jgi:ech hydrogenase subunit A
MPKTSIMMQIGMAGMFLAPFGMLISKWAVLKALVDFNPLLAVFVVFGSAATLFFWVKWMGKIIEVVKGLDDLEAGIHGTEWFPLYALSGMTIGVCAFYPVISSLLIEPFVIDIYGQTMSMGHGNIVIMSIMMGMIALFPLSFINYGKKVKVVDAYLGGANAESSIKFHGAAGSIQNMEMKNYYLEKYFGEDKLTNTGLVLCSIFMLAMIGAAFL